MREIKFRAWDKDNKLMCGINGIYQGVYEPDKLEFDIFNEKTGYQIYHVLQDEDIKVMQFTGLLDKNDKEIYEGDIVTEDDEIGLVRYGDGMFYAFNYGFEHAILSSPKDLEVIGNKFENPELLE